MMWGETPDFTFAVIETFLQIQFQSQQLKSQYFRECTEKIESDKREVILLGWGNNKN